MSFTSRNGFSPSSSTKQKVKFFKLPSITEQYRRNLLDALIETDPLLQATWQNDIENCRELLKNGHKYTRAEAENFHPVLVAAQKGHLEILQLLLENGANVNTQDKKNFTALHYAIQQRNLSCCNVLLNHGIDIFLTDKFGNLPLHVAASEGILKMVEVLVEKGCDVNSRNKKDQTPVHCSVMKGQSDVLRYLLLHKGRWDLKDVNFWLPIHWAAYHGHFECCDILIGSSEDREKEHTNSITKDKASALLLAAKKGNSKCCQQLKNSDVNIRDSKGSTALHHSASAGFLRTVEVLLSMNPDAYIRNKDGNTPLHNVVQQDNGIECLKLLTSYCTKSPGINEYDHTIFHLAALRSSFECLNYLIENKIYLNELSSQDNQGKTPLHIALLQKNSKCAEILINSSADCILKDEKENLPLHVAAGAGMINECRMLLLGTRARKVNSKNVDGATPLHLAAMNGSYDCCKQLITKGADLFSFDSNGFTPFHRACHEGKIDVIKFFTRKGGNSINQIVELSGDTNLHLATRGGYYKCCEFIIQNIKRDYIIKRNNKKNSALDDAFLLINDEIFKLILSKVVYPIVNKDQSLEFQCSLHLYMHDAIESSRSVITRAIVESNWWQAGVSSIFCNKTEEPCRNLITLTEIHPELVQILYDHCVNSEGFHVTYDFRIFEDAYYFPTSQSRFYIEDENADDVVTHVRESAFDVETGLLRPGVLKFRNQSSHTLEIVADKEYLELMQHPLVEAYLTYKWSSYMTFILYFLAFFEATLVLILAFYMTHVWNYDLKSLANVTRYALCINSSENFNSEAADQISTIKSFFPIITVLYSFLVFMTTSLIITELYLFLKLRSSFFDLIRAARIYRVIGLVLLLCPMNACIYDFVIKEPWQWQIGIITLLLSWFHLIVSINEIPTLSVFMPLTQGFIMSFLKVMIYILLIIFIFAFIFYLLLPGLPAFKTLPMAFIKTIVWILGDLAYDDTFLEEKGQIMYPALTNVIFLLLVTSISGFLINLALTQSTDHLQYFREQAVTYKLATRIKLLLRIDKIFSFIRKKYTVAFYKEKVNEKSLEKIEKLKYETFSKVDHESDKRENFLLESILGRLEQIENQLSELSKK